MSKIFDKIIKYNLILLVFLLPIFFLPFSFDIFEFNKQYLLFFLVSIAFLSWLTKMILVNKEVRFRRSLLDFFVLIFLFIAILSTIFSVDKNSSIYGFYGRFSDGLLNLISLALLYFLIVNNFQAESFGKKFIINKNITQNRPLFSIESFKKIFLASSALIIITSILSVFGVFTKINTLKLQSINFSIQLPAVMERNAFNPVAGTMEGLSIFLAILSVFLINLIIFSRSNLNKIFYWILLIPSLFLISIIRFSPAWIVIALSMILLIVICLKKRLLEDTSSLILPIILIIISLIFISPNPLKDTFNSFVNQKLSLLSEITVSQKTSYLISFRAATENVKNIFLGSGIGTFYHDFVKFKPVGINNTPFWNIRFDRGGSYVAELLGTTGFLGIISYFLLIIFFFIFLLRFLDSQDKIKNKDFQQIPFLLTFLTIFISQFLYYQNAVLTFSFWLFLGISTIVLKETPPKEKEYAFSFKNSPELSIFFYSFLIILAIVFLIIYFFAIRFYLSDVDYKKALLNNDIGMLEKSVKLNPHLSNYKIVLSRSYLNLILNEKQKPLNEQNKDFMAVNAYYAITFAKGNKDLKIKGATEISPNFVASWETLGMIYRDIRDFPVGSSTEFAIASFEKAVSLEPTNPVLYTEIGILYAELNQNDKAVANLEKAINIKPDYVNADILFYLGRSYYNSGENDKAISIFEKAIELNPDHANSLYALGLAYQKNGEIQKAISVFEKVLELNPGNSDVINKLEGLKGETKK